MNFHKRILVVCTCHRVLEDDAYSGRSCLNLPVSQEVFACVEKHFCCNSDIFVQYFSNCFHSSMTDRIRRKYIHQNIFFYLGMECAVENCERNLNLDDTCSYRSGISGGAKKCTSLICYKTPLCQRVSCKQSRGLITFRYQKFCL